jgi:hypothetical protein
MWTLASIVGGAALALVMSLVGLWLISQWWLWRPSRSPFNPLDIDVHAISDARLEDVRRRSIEAARWPSDRVPDRGFVGPAYQHH